MAVPRRHPSHACYTYINYGPLEGLRTAASRARDAEAWEQLANELEEKLGAEQQARAEDRERLGRQIQQLRITVATYEAERSAGDAEDDGGTASALTPALAYFARGGGRPALDFVDELEEGDRVAALRSLAELVKHAFDGSSKRVDKVRGGTQNSARSKLYEYRVNTKDLWLRFFFAKSIRTNEILLLCGYAKKQNELDKSQIERAEKCLTEAWKSGWQ